MPEAGKRLWIKGTKHKGHKILSAVPLCDRYGSLAGVTGYTNAGMFILPFGATFLQRVTVR